ncbi:hypothetical protein DDB_G0271770 [Dictyostelium discoideum AX4]|uniref:Uncharacterized protein n=1 Tax=Dictyostelium discoideum TaxID=44689 RepID=Q75J98_DICDI|nr:hypothetical protein DDB_G0271770 [Dictyostelium discoideum AX4]EAL71575.2 hypothetical protein DDB_G0271770 [Dictyostelium discoideum AX4]|eukprot:XP_645522.2 hypothetical protein DDB_G0271770 [Dictyostelium discoideum AX4]
MYIFIDALTKLSLGGSKSVSSKSVSSNSTSINFGNNNITWNGLPPPPAIPPMRDVPEEE